MLQLLRWPNGDYRVLDAASLLASPWLTSEPSGSLGAVPLPCDVGQDEPGGTRRFRNDARYIASNAPAAEVDSWFPPDFRLVRSEGIGSVQAAVTVALAATAATQERTMLRNFRRLTRADEDDE
jgi:hypothetical protein